MPSKRKTSEADSAAAADVRRSKRLAKEQSAADTTPGGTRYGLDVYGRMELHHYDEENRERERARDADGPVVKSERLRSCPPSATPVRNVERAVSLRNRTPAPDPIPTSGPAPGSSSVATLQPREQMAKQRENAMQTLTQSQIYTIISQEPQMGNELVAGIETGTGIGTGTTGPSTTTPLPFISRTPAPPKPQPSYNNNINTQRASLYGIPATPCHGFIPSDQRLAHYRQDMRAQHIGGYRHGGGSGAGEIERKIPMQNDKTMNQANGNSKSTGTGKSNDKNNAKGIPIPSPISTPTNTTATTSRPHQQQQQLDQGRDLNEDLLGPAYHMTLNPVVRRSRTCACGSFCITMIRPS